MDRSSAYMVLGATFAREVESCPSLLAVALARAKEKGDSFKADALRALGGR